MPAAVFASLAAKLRNGSRIDHCALLMDLGGAEHRLERVALCNRRKQSAILLKASSFQGHMTPRGVSRRSNWCVHVLFL